MEYVHLRASMTIRPGLNSYKAIKLLCRLIVRGIGAIIRTNSSSVLHHHHVHFGEEADSFGKDNEIVLQLEGEKKLGVHLGFLKVRHRYEIKFDIPRSLCGIGETSELKESYPFKVPNVNCKFHSIVSDKYVIRVTLELLAHKEKLLKEELCLECTTTNSLFRLHILARVLGKGKGTPLLRNGIRCIAVQDVDDESEVSDWQGFE